MACIGHNNIGHNYVGHSCVRMWPEARSLEVTDGSAVEPRVAAIDESDGKVDGTGRTCVGQAMTTSAMVA